MKPGVERRIGESLSVSGASSSPFPVLTMMSPSTSYSSRRLVVAGSHRLAPRPSTPGMCTRHRYHRPHGDFASYPTSECSMPYIDSRYALPRGENYEARRDRPRTGPQHRGRRAAEVHRRAPSFHSTTRTGPYLDARRSTDNLDWQPQLPTPTHLGHRGGRRSLPRCRWSRVHRFPPRDLPRILRSCSGGGGRGSGASGGAWLDVPAADGGRAVGG